jgi:hypothetical protein
MLFFLIVPSVYHASFSDVSRRPTSQNVVDALLAATVQKTVSKEQNAAAESNARLAQSFSPNLALVGRQVGRPASSNSVRAG